MALHFSPEEFQHRRNQTCRVLEERNLDGLLLFRQESMYYLTGYDTAGYVRFQCLYLTADGEMALLTRSADRIQAALTSVIADIRIWKDEVGARPATDLKTLVADLGGAGKRLGVEYEAYGLTGAHCKALEQAFEGFARLEDASDIVRTQRLTKSESELNYVRQAGALSDQALAVATRDCVPGAVVGAIYGDMMRVILAGGGRRRSTACSLSHRNGAWQSRRARPDDIRVRCRLPPLSCPANDRSINRRTRYPPGRNVRSLPRCPRRSTGKPEAREYRGSVVRRPRTRL